MAWTITCDNAAFFDAAGSFVQERPDRHTLLISTAESLRTTGPDGAEPPRYGWWRGPDGAVAAAFVWAPPSAVHLSVMAPQLAAELATALLAGSLAPTQVGGRESTARAFGARWARATGGTQRVGSRYRLYRLGELAPPAPAPPGAARLATGADRELLVDWFEAFHRDLGEDPAGSARRVDARLGHGGCLLWEVAGVPVAMAGTTPLVGGMVRVLGVYTPPAHRRRGYAGALVAAVSDRALARGVPHVLLFTDLGNPTTNALYQRLGYRLVEDRVTLVLDAARAPV